MNLRLLKNLACASILSIAAAFALRAAEPAIGPAEMLKVAVDEVLAIAYDQTNASTPLAQRVRPLLEKNFNFEAVTRRAVGPGWRKFTPEQKARTVSLFTEVV
ncbi:MAG: ABC transporter substrate-binding protein, partial [Opitutaceae bacterium]|nr:ABC transporter substrate-binding protein [Opitutaceae bacterium]